MQILYEKEFQVYFRFLFFKVDLLNDSSGKIDLKKLSDTLDDSPTETHASESNTEKMVSSPILQQLKALLRILRILFNTFRQNIHVKFSKIYVKVGTEDAAKTALLYGAISTASILHEDLVPGTGD